MKGGNMKKSDYVLSADLHYCMHCGKALAARFYLNRETFGCICIDCYNNLEEAD